MASHRCTYIKAIHGFQAVDTAAQDRLASTALRTVGPKNKNPTKINLFIVQKLYDLILLQATFWQILGLKHMQYQETEMDINPLKPGWKKIVKVIFGGFWVIWNHSAAAASFSPSKGS